MAINFHSSFSQFSFNSSSLVGGFVSAGSVHQSTTISSHFQSSFQQGGMSGFDKLFGGTLRDIFKMPPMLPFFGPIHIPGHHGPIRPRPGGNGGINPAPIQMRYGIRPPIIEQPPIKAVYGIMVNDRYFLA